MENHPIPQDVTGFKFKLIGSITVKQFLYLLGFGILATIMFVLHINPFIKIPLMLLFAGIGASLAFVPIEGRPMDVMITNFAKTVPNENRFIYKKRGVSIAHYDVFTQPIIKPQITAQIPTNQSSSNNKKVLLERRLRDTTFRPDDQETKFLKNINSIFDTGAPAAIVTPVAQPIVASVQKPIEETAETVNKTAVFQEQKPASAVQAPVAPNPVMDPGQRAQSDQEYQFKKAQESASAPTPAPEQNPVGTTVPTSAPKVGFPSLPDVGNVIMGTVCDPRGRTLPNVLVEVIDNNNVPVRAFKTNALGQFASATPLPNGTYKIILDDPQKQHDFQEVNVDLDGSIFMPLQMISVDAREKLRRELFGGQGAQIGAAA